MRKLIMAEPPAQLTGLKDQSCLPGEERAESQPRRLQTEKRS